MRRIAGLAGAAGLLAVAAHGSAAGQAQERFSQTFECQGENACRVACVGLPDVSRVESLVIEDPGWGGDRLLVTVTHEFGVTTLVLQYYAQCRLDNLQRVP